VSEKFVQLLIVTDGKLKMTRDDTGLLVITSSISGQLEDFGSEIFENSGKVDGGTCAKLVVHQDASERIATYRHQHAERSCPFGEVCEHVQQGTRDQPWKNACNAETISKLKSKSKSHPK